MNLPRLLDGVACCVAVLIAGAGCGRDDDGAVEVVRVCRPSPRDTLWRFVEIADVVVVASVTGRSRPLPQRGKVTLSIVEVIKGDIAGPTVEVALPSGEWAPWPTDGRPMILGVLRLSVGLMATAFRPLEVSRARQVRAAVVASGSPPPVSGRSARRIRRLRDALTVRTSADMAILELARADVEDFPAMIAGLDDSRPFAGENRPYRTPEGLRLWQQPDSVSEVLAMILTYRTGESSPCVWGEFPGRIEYRPRCARYFRRYLAEDYRRACGLER